MSKHALVALAFLFSASAGSQPTHAPTDPGNRPGGTTQIAPTPGPATSPALPSPSLPPAAVENREKAQAAKAERKTQKKAAKTTVKRAKGAQAGNKTNAGAPAGTSTTPPAR